MQTLYPNAPHWYLAFTGVDVGEQGHGIGANLLSPVLALADETSTLCYLETPFPRTHAFYQRLGFTITSATHPFSGAPTLWTMTRLPQSNGMIGGREAPLAARGSRNGLA